VFVDVGRSLWREDGTAIYNCCWPRQRSHSRVRIPWDSWPNFTVSDSRLPFSSSPTTSRIAVEYLHRMFIMLSFIRWRYVYTLVSEFFSEFVSRLISLLLWKSLCPLLSICFTHQINLIYVDILCTLSVAFFFVPLWNVNLGKRDVNLLMNVQHTWFDCYAG
jgi:hypothetical protein